MEPAQSGQEARALTLVPRAGAGFEKVVPNRNLKLMDQMLGGAAASGTELRAFNCQHPTWNRSRLAAAVWRRTSMQPRMEHRLNTDSKCPEPGPHRESAD